LLSDGDLLAKLRSFDIDLDRSSLEQLCGQALSAEEIAKPLLDQRTFYGKHENLESDWILDLFGDLVAALVFRPTLFRGVG